MRAAGVGSVPRTAPTPQTTLPDTVKAKSVSQADEFPEHAAGELDRRHAQLSSREKVNSVQAATWNRVLDMLAPFAFWVLRIAALFGGLALAYVLWGIFSGALQSSVGNAPQTTNNVTSAIYILCWALIGIAVSCLILVWEEKFVAIAIAAVGLLLYFGAPPLLAMAGDTKALSLAARELQKGGLPLMAIGGLKYGFDMMRWVIDLPNRMRGVANVGVVQQAEPRQQREAQYATMFSPCWKLPFCREVIRKQCPAYLAKKTCWKFGRGCYCDEEMISRIIRGESLDTIKAPTRISRQGKPPCGRCYIFLEHQGMKYRAFSPLAIPATIGIMYFGWSTYLTLTETVMKSMSFLWDKLAFHSVNTAAQVANSVNKETERAASTLSPEAVQSAAQTTIGILLGFTLLIYMSKAIEWAIYKARL